MSEDLKLLDAWRGGDKAAGATLLRRHFDSLYRFFANKVDHGAEDLIQRTMLAAVRSRDRFEGRSSFRTYLFTIARNELYAHFRGLRRDRAMFDPATHDVHDMGSSPSRILERHREHKLLLLALQRLPVELQVALELHYWEGLDGKAIAAILEIPLGTVKSRLRRAKEALREHLKALAESAAELERTQGDIDGWARELRAAMGAAPPGGAGES